MRLWRLSLPMLIAIAFGLLWGHHQPSTGWVWILGCAIGWLLVRSRFGFSGPIRRLIEHGDAQAMAPLATLLTLLILGSGLLLHMAEPLGIDVRPTRVPMSLSFAAGAFLFGIGMQLAQRCASGTLASAAEPNGRFGTTLIALVIGVFLGSLHRPNLEQAMPASVPAIVLLDTLPVSLAVLAQLGLLFLCMEGLVALCRLRLRLSRPTPPPPQLPEAAPPSTGMVAGLALLLLLLFGVSGEPWKVLWGLGLSGAHLAKSVGWDPHSSPFWAASSRLALLTESRQWIQQEAIVVNLGVMYGAMAAGQLARWRQPKAMRQSTVLLAKPFRAMMFRDGTGGVLMGYGGFLAYGCNISSFVGGVMSFSLHGWLWFIAAMAGSAFWLHVEQLTQWLNAPDQPCAGI